MAENPPSLLAEAALKEEVWLIIPFDPATLVGFRAG